MAAVLEVAGEVGLLLADQLSVVHRLLPVGAAHRPGPVAALHAGEPQRRGVVLGQPQAVVGGDVEDEAGVLEAVRRPRRLARAPHRQVVRQPHVRVEVRAVEVVDEGHAELESRSGCCRATARDLRAERIEPLVPERRGTGRARRRPPPSARCRARRAAARRRPGPRRSRSRAAPAAASRRPAGRCRTPPVIASVTSPEDRSPSASSSRIRRRTGSPRTSKASTGQPCCSGRARCTPPCSAAPAARAASGSVPARDAGLDPLLAASGHALDQVGAGPPGRPSTPATCGRVGVGGEQVLVETHQRHLPADPDGSGPNSSHIFGSTGAVCSSSSRVCVLDGGQRDVDPAHLTAVLPGERERRAAAYSSSTSPPALPSIW